MIFIIFDPIMSVTDNNKIMRRRLANAYLSSIISISLVLLLVGVAAWVCMRYIPQTRASGLTTERYKIPIYLVYTVNAC